MVKRFTLLFSISLLFLASCRKEIAVQEDIQNKVYFSSSISGQTYTKVSGSNWEAGDAISVFMHQYGQELSTQSILNEAFNKTFVTSSGNGNFSPSGEANEITFPSTVQASFTAFYPYRNMTSLELELDIASQTRQQDIDFMLSKNTAPHAVGSGPISLVFERLMTKVELQVIGAEANMQAMLKSAPNKASLNLSNSMLQIGTEVTDIDGKVTMINSNTAKVEWTLFPGELKDDARIVFTIDGKSYTWNIGKQNFVKSHRYSYDVTLGEAVVNPIPKVSYMELPVVSTGADLQYSFKMTPDRSKRNFSMLYDTKNKLAYWVAYPLSNDYLGSQSRTDNWGYDPDFNRSFQPLLSSGFGVSGIDRGHQLPSADRTKNYAENSTTFYYTNMTAQASFLNQRTWASLEDKIRTWTRLGTTDTMYVVTGAMIATNVDKNIEYVTDNAGQQVAKPKYYYKALAIKSGSNYYTIGFKMDNVPHSSTQNIMNYRVTVKDLEDETGFTFFPGLTPEQKVSYDASKWR